MTDQSYQVTASEIRAFVERIERLDAEKKDLAEEEAVLEMYKEALGM